MAQVPPKPAGSGPMRPSLMTFRRLGGHYSSLTCISRDIIRARATEGHPCLTALRRPWLRADRHRLAPTSMSRKPATTLGCPPASRGPNARRGRERRRERAGHGGPASGRRFERSQGWRSEIKQAAPPGCRAAVERETRFDHLRASRERWICGCRCRGFAPNQAKVCSR